MDLNQVLIPDVQQELGEKGWKQVKLLCAFLYCNNLHTLRQDQEWKKFLPDYGRFASSIVTLSEGGVFGLSRPRFCYRLYFASQKAFVNCRRFEVFRRQLAENPPWTGRWKDLTPVSAHPRIKGEASDPELLNEDARTPVIADCLLETPSRFPAKFWSVIRSNLDQDFGESLTPSKTKWATPFVKHAEIGGGVCAQANCFMVTAMLSHFTTGVHSLCEITALASPEEVRELPVSGLDEFEMARYFDKAGLSASVQFATIVPTSSDASVFFQEALHSYVASGFPVVLTVDQSKLNGVGITGASLYSKNGLNAISIIASKSPHAITVVGCSRWEGEPFQPKQQHEDYYLCNDPATMPFIQASLDDLMKVGVSSGERTYPTLIPATPAAVKMPLLRWAQTPKGLARFGLLDMSRLHCSPRSSFGRREFLLMQIRDIHASIRMIRHFDEAIRPSIWERIRKISRDADAAGWSQDHWVWLECGHNYFKMWDAEKNCDPADPTKYFLGAIWVLEQRIETKTNFEAVNGSGDEATQNSNCVLPHRADPPKLKASLISSFTVLGSEKAATNWPSSVEYVEFYACMPKDLGLFDIQPKERHHHSVNANHALANCWNKGLAKKFAAKLRSKYESHRAVCGFATFMPELLGHSEPIYRNAQEALAFLIETADHLDGDWPFTIELVGGSRWYGVWWAEALTGERHFAINKLRSTEAIDLLLERLMPVAELAVSCKRRKVQLAIELQPGPLYVIRNRETIRALCEKLESQETDENLKKTVGLNLNVAHWAFLSDITLAWLEDSTNAMVKKRIVHAHISDHNKGHFSDNVIGSIHSSEFKDWIAFLADVNAGSAQREPNYPQYSGFVSCELEACKSKDFVSRSTERLLGLLALK